MSVFRVQTVLAGVGLRKQGFAAANQITLVSNLRRRQTLTLRAARLRDAYTHTHTRRRGQIGCVMMDQQSVCGVSVAYLYQTPWRLETAVFLHDLMKQETERSHPHSQFSFCDSGVKFQLFLLSTE